MGIQSIHKYEEPLLRIFYLQKSPPYLWCCSPSGTSVAVISLLQLAKHVPDTSLLSGAVGTFQNRILALLECMDTGQTQRCMFTSTSDLPQRQLLAMATLASGIEGRPTACPEPNTPFTFKRTAFHFCSHNAQLLGLLLYLHSKQQPSP